MGAWPIALVDPLFFGRMDFPYNDLPRGVKHPQFIQNGVIAGIRDYGNRVGVPTVAGMIAYDDAYLTNCLVNVGCVGIVDKEKITSSTIAKERGKKGDVFILLGGRTGRDGIHGVTFASTELHEESEAEDRSAVQVGNPIIKEPLMHVCQEIVEKNLAKAMKDLGGGGLSCCVDEMSYPHFGAVVYLEKVPLKERDMEPWEIWVSESQERMMVLVDSKNVEKVTDICELWDIEYSTIGELTGDNRITVIYHGESIVDMEIEFLVEPPVYNRPYTVKDLVETERETEEPLYEEMILDLLRSPNIRRKSFAIQQYDHEVGARTVTKPLQGRIESPTHSDAVIIKPLVDTKKGIAIATDSSPALMKRSPYWGAKYTMDEICRNLAAAGAVPHSFADCLNFGNPEKPERMGEFYEACRGLGEFARSLGVPFVSGNVSFYNESEYYSVIPTPTILGVGIIDDSERGVTTDLKRKGDMLYLVGEIKKEMAGSAYYDLCGYDFGSVPKCDPHELTHKIDAIIEAQDIMEACHDLSTGGLAVAISEMMVGGRIGVSLDLEQILLRTDYALFSESSCFVCEVRKQNRKNFETIMTDHDVPFCRIGEVSGEKLIITHGEKRIMLSLREIEEAFT
jgi:phosphoribosylformylglycinamidine synthase